jgi:signal transduction histidine kinase
VDLDSLLAEVLFEQKDLIAARGARVVATKGLGTVWANPLRVRQVLTNLLRNALKHGCDAREPRIEIAQAPAPQGETVRSRDRRVWLRVSDNGRGVPAAYREKIFLPGQRAPGGAEDGSGLGLAIVRRIVEHYQGTIRLDPAWPQGASFVFSLPASDR